MKKFLPVAGLLVASITHLFGAYNSNNNNGSMQQQQMPAKSCPPAKSCFSCCDESESSCNPPGLINDCMPKMITPAAGPRVCCGCDVFVTADFIYWTSRMDGLGYAVNNWRSANLTDTQNPSKGSVYHPDFSGDPGFKVGLGLGLCHDGWDIFAQYTWLYTDTKTDSVRQNIDDINDSTLGPMWFDDASNIPAGNAPSSPFVSIINASSSWKLHFNVIDLELGRNMFVSRYLKIRPHFGLKGAWYDADYSVRYLNTLTPPTSAADSMYMSQDQDYWGVGIRTGFNTAWHFSRCFSIVGNVALSALWSQFETTRKDQFYSSVDTTVPSLISFWTENSFHTVKPVLELFLGLRWDTWFCDEDFHFSADIGWEEQMWWNQNQFYRVYEEGAHGDLGFQGLTIHFRFDF